MPKTRNVQPERIASVEAHTPGNRKRKRGAAGPLRVEPAVEASPKSRTHTKADGVHPNSKFRSVEVEEEVTTTVKAETNGKVEIDEEVEVTVVAEGTPSQKRKRRRRKSKSAATPEADKGEQGATEEAQVVKQKRKRRTKEEKEAEAMPLAARTVGLKMYVGAHTSIAKGVENAITNCVHIGGNAFACFLKSQRKWENPELKDENRDAFRKALMEHKYDGMSHIVPHGSYLVNLATEDADKLKQSYDTFVNDLHRCEALGICHYNFHPGGAGQSPLGEAITRLANNLNRALSETKTVVPLLENMAGHGTLIGGRFSDLRDVIAQIKPEYENRIGVCIDTCHAFAAGYDLRSPEAFQKTMDEFDKVVGFKYLKALHLNDSKMPLSSHRDLHQNIGLGFLGLRAFHNVMNEPRFQGLPLILETPCEKPDPDDPKGKKMIEDKKIWATEIKLLESLIGMDPDGDEFRKLESELSERGRGEREKLQAQYDRITQQKADKEKKRLMKERDKGQKSLKDMFGAKENGKVKANGVKGKKTKKDENLGSESSEQSESPLSDLSDLSDEGK